MTTEFEGRIALVTAAAGAGIGQATARGSRPAARTSWSPTSTSAAPARSPRRSRPTIPTRRSSATRWTPATAPRSTTVVAEVTRTLGPVQILVNNAAVNVVGSIFDYDPEHWDWCVRVNLSGPWYLCRAVMPLMRDAGGGVIVNVQQLRRPTSAAPGSRRRTRSPRADSTC